MIKLSDKLENRTRRDIVEVLEAIVKQAGSIDKLPTQAEVTEYIGKLLFEGLMDYNKKCFESGKKIIKFPDSKEVNNGRK